MTEAWIIFLCIAIAAYISWWYDFSDLPESEEEEKTK